MTDHSDAEEPGRGYPRRPYHCEPSRCDHTARFEAGSLKLDVAVGMPLSGIVNNISADKIFEEVFKRYCEEKKIEPRHVSTRMSITPSRGVKVHDALRDHFRLHLDLLMFDIL